MQNSLRDQPKFVFDAHQKSDKNGEPNTCSRFRRLADRVSRRGRSNAACLFRCGDLARRAVRCIGIAPTSVQRAMSSRLEELPRRLVRRRWRLPIPAPSTAGKLVQIVAARPQNHTIAFSYEGGLSAASAPALLSCLPAGGNVLPANGLAQPIGRQPKFSRQLPGGL